MRRAVVAIVPWVARLGTWALLLGLAAYIAANHQGISVRARVAQASLPPERDRAKRALLERAPIGHLVSAADRVEPMGWMRRDTAFILSSDPVIAGFAVFPRGVDLDRLRAGRTLDRRIYVGFDGNGRVIGEPIVIPEGGPARGYGVPTQIIAGDSAHYMLFWHWVQPAATQPTTAPATVEFYLHVVRLLGSESKPIFALHSGNPNGLWLMLDATRRRDGRVALELSQRPYGRPRELQLMATFVWDESLGRFVGPQSDVRGRWEVIDLTPLPAPEP